MKGKQRTRHTLANSCKHTADTGSVSKGNTTKATKPRETSEGTPGQGRSLESIPNDAQHRGPEKPRLALWQGPRQRTQETMSLPATEPNRTRNLGIQASTAEKSPQPDCSLPRCSAVCPCPEAEASADLKGRVCGNADDAGSGTAPPPRGIWPFARRNRKGTREPQAGPGHLYRPTRVTLSPFPVSLGRVFSGYVCLKQAQADVGHKPVGRVCPHPRGEWAWRDGGVQAAPAAQADLTPSRSLHPPRGGWGVSEQPCISAHSGSRSSSGQKQQPHGPGAARQQG